MTEPTSAQDLFKRRHFDQEIIILCVRWYLAFKLSSRDLVQMVLVRPFTITVALSRANPSAIAKPIPAVDQLTNASFSLSNRSIHV
jgi:transposase-like protein